MSNAFKLDFHDKKPSGAELRKYDRVALQGHAILHDEEKLFIAPVENISAGGLFVSRLVHIPEGRDVKVIVKSPSFAEPIQAQGVVVRIENDKRVGLAVEFKDLPQGTRDILVAYVLETRFKNAMKPVVR